ncbi:ABC transporter ATP-binding protein [[Clostridium] fimetarium]|uniref:Putative ABC transport system ATP-binding protein n=1 Tax=[Clostridium] fimetarium TaxID=99656 RepID=A0A1I0R882_9FIRM|nr:ABC transporter ATP-binding protein [[Clostridium] fimetarium]SEW36835.1 putative ABC transport system ATP-binding protein [[Clostridium] fimetarium]
MKNSILKASGLCKSFATNGVQNHVLSNVDLEIFKGDFTVIMGSSGSGKSTLLYALSGMDTVTSGEVIYNNQDITKMSENRLSYLRRNDFGFIFQQMHLVSNLSLYENVVVPGYLPKIHSNKEVNEKGSALLEKVGITEQRKRLPSQVSGGEQQRACIARALINDPTVIFADEPTGALNKATGKEVLDLLTQINEVGQSILMVTHDVKAALRGNRILYIEDGNVVGEMNLNKYNKENSKAIETQITSWLLARGW